MNLEQFGAEIEKTLAEYEKAISVAAEQAGSHLREIFRSFLGRQLAEDEGYDGEMRKRLD